MPSFRITKYDPAFRDGRGVYRRDDWTSVSDIGRSFRGAVLSEKDYLAVEDAYVESILRILKAVDVSELEVHGLEDSGLRGPTILHDADLQVLRSNLRNGAVLRGGEIPSLVRLNLRELVWCRLMGRHGAYVHFGHDYYMYVGCERTNFIMPNLPSALFVESMVSPYAEE